MKQLRKIKLTPGYQALAIMLATLAVIVLLMPRNSDSKLSYEVNRPWTHALLTAPFDVPIYRDEMSSQRLRDSLRASFVPYYTVDNRAYDRIEKALKETHELAASDRRKLLKVVRTVYDDGVVEGVADSTYNAKTRPAIMVREEDGGGEATYDRYPTEGMRTQREAYLYIDSVVGDSEVRSTLQSINLPALLEPNLRVDEAESIRQLKQTMSGANVAIGVVQQGERIIDRGDIVTPQLYIILSTYETMLAERDTDRSGRVLMMILGQILFVAVCLGGLAAYLYFYRRDILENPRYLTAVMTLVAGTYTLAVIMSSVFSGGMYIMPFCIVPIIITVFFDGRTALFVHTMILLLCLTMATFVIEFLVVELVAGVALVSALQELSRRSQLIRAAGIVFVAYLFAYIAVELMTAGSADGLTWSLIGYFAISTVLTSFAYLLIFIFEKVFGLISVVTLVELSDINNPVLLRLSEECPGTFQHSMGVSTLAAAAATRVGANVQLVRTGALYHDIGKIVNPAFFTENQYGINPHDALSPVQSARIIVSHVSDGIKLADKSKLPQAIKDMILQHHGRGMAKYFYTTYCQRHPDEEPDKALFSYPGPNPQTREASILMMADAVEAASRSLKEHTVEAITNLVNKIVDGQVDDGLHSESPLSFRDVKVIKESFIQRLRSMYHARVSYPPDVRKKQAATTDAG